MSSRWRWFLPLALFGPVCFTLLVAPPGAIGQDTPPPDEPDDQAQDESSFFGTIRNEDYQFEISFPAKEWVGNPEAQQREMIFLASNERTKSFVYLQRFELSCPTFREFEYALDVQGQALRKEAIGFKPRATRFIHAGDQLVHQLTHVRKDSHARQFLTDRLTYYTEEALFVLTLSCLLENLELASEDLERIRASFRLLSETVKKKPAPWPAELAEERSFGDEELLWQPPLGWIEGKGSEPLLASFRTPLGTNVMIIRVDTSIPLDEFINEGITEREEQSSLETLEAKKRILHGRAAYQAVRKMMIQNARFQHYLTVVDAGEMKYVLTFSCRAGAFPYYEDLFRASADTLQVPRQ